MRPAREVKVELFNGTSVERLALFDANCRLGPGEHDPPGAPAHGDELLAEMDRVGIAEALVYHAAAAAYDAGYGNQALLEAVAGRPRLHPCWVYTVGKDSGSNGAREWVKKCVAAGVRAVRIFPSRQRFSLSSWSIDRLLEELPGHGLPLFVDFDRAHWADDNVDYDSLHRICTTFPELRVVLVREGIGSARFLYPLLEGVKNLLIETSYYQPAGGLEQFAVRFGADRLLFGTGLPVYSPGPPIAMLLASELSETQKKLVAGGNLRRLL